MALTVGEDGIGVFAIMECDERGCYAHLAVRPGQDPATGYEMACETFDLAQDCGWGLQGDTYCPPHARRRAGRAEKRRRRPTLGDAFSWARTAVGGGQGPS